jgi:hypothetical protein
VHARTSSGITGRLIATSQHLLDSLVSNRSDREPIWEPHATTISAGIRIDQDAALGWAASPDHSSTTLCWAGAQSRSRVQVPLGHGLVNIAHSPCEFSLLAMLPIDRRAACVRLASLPDICQRDQEHRATAVHAAGRSNSLRRRPEDKQYDMTWVKRFIVFLIVGFFLFYLVSQPVAAANAVRAVAGGLAIVFRSILVFFQSLAG